MYSKTILIGNVGKDAELRVFPSGNKKASFSLATNRSYKDKNDEWQTITQWHKIGVSGFAAERASEFKKGDLIHVDGETIYHKIETEEGNKYFTEIEARIVKKLNRDEGAKNSFVSNPPNDEDLPF